MTCREAFRRASHEMERLSRSDPNRDLLHWLDEGDDIMRNVDMYIEGRRSASEAGLSVMYALGYIRFAIPRLSGTLHRVVRNPRVAYSALESSLASVESGGDTARNVCSAVVWMAASMLAATAGAVETPLLDETLLQFPELMPPAEQDLEDWNLSAVSHSFADAYATYLSILPIVDMCRVEPLDLREWTRASACEFLRKEGIAGRTSSLSHVVWRCEAMLVLPLLA